MNEIFTVVGFMAITGGVLVIGAILWLKASNQILKNINETWWIVTYSCWKHRKQKESATAAYRALYSAVRQMHKEDLGSEMQCPYCGHQVRRISNENEEEVYSNATPERGGPAMQVGTKVRIEQHYGDSLTGKVGFIRSIEDNGKVRVSSEPDPCSEGFDLRQPHWSVWLGEDDVVEVLEEPPNEG